MQMLNTPVMLNKYDMENSDELGDIRVQCMKQTLAPIFWFGTWNTVIVPSS